MLRLLMALTVSLLAAGSALAQGAADPYKGDRAFRDRANVDLGWVLASFDSQMSLDPSGGSGTTVDLEDGVGMDKDTNDFFFRGYYRFKPKHRIEASYYGLKREGNRVIDQQIVWGDYTWDVNALLESESQATFARVGYAWSFVRKPKVDVNFHTDLAYLETGLTLRGTTSTGTYADEDGSAGFPYPTLGLSLNGYLGKHVVADLRLDWIGGFEVSGVEGSILAGEIGVRGYLTRHIGLGVHWILWEVDASTTDADKDLEVDYGFDGLTGTLSFVW